MWRRPFIFAAGLLLGRAVRAQTAPSLKYAGLSLLGDKLSVVTYQPKTGSQVDRNSVESVALPDLAFDKFALLDMQSTLQKREAKATLLMLAAAGPALYERAGELAVNARLDLPDDIRQALAAAEITHLILLRKHRAEARMQAERGRLGSGMIEGLGFYLDRHYKMKRTDTGEVGVGFLAPFVFVKLSLIELSSASEIRAEAISASTTLSAARGGNDGDPWNVLSPEQKIERLKAMLGRELKRSLPLLLAPR